jgi:hypothetical protein
MSWNLTLNEYKNKWNRIVKGIDGKATNIRYIENVVLWLDK